MIDKPTQLVINDPHDQPNLIDHIPSGVGPSQIINFYHYYLYPEEKAYCAKCGARRHRDGFTVELDNGKLALAGSTCGSDLWGERWSTIGRKFEARLQAAGIILDARSVVDDLQKIREALVSNWHPMVNKYDGFQGHFRSKMPLVYKKLREASLAAEPQIAAPGRPPISFEGAAFFLIENVPERFQARHFQPGTDHLFSLASTAFFDSEVAFWYELPDPAAKSLSPRSTARAALARHRAFGAFESRQPTR